MGAMRARKSVNRKNRDPKVSSKTDKEFQPMAHDRGDNFQSSNYSQGTQTDFTEVPASSESAIKRDASHPSNTEPIYAISTPL